LNVVKRFKDAAYFIAAESAKLGKAFEKDAGIKEQNLTNKELKQLAELGYGGLIAVEKMKLTSSKPLNPKRAKDLVDRSLLDRGDLFLWDLFISFNDNQEINMDTKEFNARSKKAHEDYMAFLKSNPDKVSWVNWRLAFLNNAKIVYSKKKDK